MRQRFSFLFSALLLPHHKFCSPSTSQTQISTTMFQVTNHCTGRSICHDLSKQPAAFSFILFLCWWVTLPCSGWITGAIETLTRDSISANWWGQPRCKKLQIKKKRKIKETFSLCSPLGKRKRSQISYCYSLLLFKFRLIIADHVRTSRTAATYIVATEELTVVTNTLCKFQSQQCVRFFMVWNILLRVPKSSVKFLALSKYFLKFSCTGFLFVLQNIKFNVRCS